jgi:hypothetical protein
MSGFQTQVYNQPAQAIAGDFASVNPWASFDAGPGGLVAGAAGCVIGGFAWVTAPDDPNGTHQIAQSTGAGIVAGFVGRAGQMAQNTVFLSDAGMTILQGSPLTLYTQGDFWVVNSGTAEALVGQKAYANFANGLVSFAATGAPTQGASATGSTITPETNSFTASISGDVMTVTGAVTGTIYPGTTISGTGITTGTQVLSQISGTAGGAGTYYVTAQDTTVASTTVSGTYGLLTIGTLTTTGSFAVGQVLAVTGAVVAGTVITANVTGTGGTGGTMIVNNNTNVGSQTISSYGNQETKWTATSSGQPGQLVKMSSWTGSQG